MKALFCMYCGERLAENARFCMKCGAPVPQAEPAGQTVPPAAVTVPPQTYAPQPGFYPPTYAPQSQTYPTQPGAYTAPSQTYAPIAPTYAPQSEPYAPQTYAPQPEVYMPQPEVYAPQPEVCEPQPEVCEPQPEVCEPQPEVCESQPEICESQPEICEPQPEVCESQPEICESQPEICESQPEICESQPEVYVPQQKPVQEYAPVPPAPPAPVKKTSTRRRRGAGRTLLAVLLCVIMFLLSVTTIALMGLQGLTSEESINALLSDTLNELPSVPASTFVKNAPKDASIVDLFVDAAKQGNFKFRAKNVMDLVGSSEFTDILTEQITGYLNDICENDDRSTLKERDIRRLLENNRDLIEENLQITLTDKNIKYLTNTAVQSGALKYTDANLLRETAPGAYYAIQYGLSIWVLCLLGGLLLLFIVLLAATNRWSVRRTTGDIGITLTVGGALIAIPTAVIPLLTETLFGRIPLGKLIGVVVTHVSHQFLFPAVCALATGAVLLLVSGIVKMVERKRG